MKKIFLSFLFFSMILGNLFAIKLGIVRGAVKLVLDEQNGAILLYTNDPDVEQSLQEVPIFSEANKHELSKYLLRIRDRIYMLSPSRGLTVTAEETLFGISITYMIENVASVLIDFLFFSSIADILQDTVRMEITITNLGSSDENFGFKGVFDTYLGEKRDWHFSTVAHSRVNQEMQFLDMEEIRWLESSDKKTSMKFILTDLDVTPPVRVDVAARSTIFANDWNPRISYGKKFSSFTAIGNSAVGITWEDFRLDPQGEKIFSYYITTAKDGADAATDLSNAMLGRAFLENDIVPFIASFHSKQLLKTSAVKKQFSAKKLMALHLDRKQDLFFFDGKRRKEYVKSHIA
ncbi:MAG: hypothetical protein ACRC4W_00665 [Treponemataceae bacterium]